MSVKLLTEHHLELQRLKGGCAGSSESTLVKTRHCWKLHVTAQIVFYQQASWSEIIWFWVLSLCIIETEVLLDMIVGVMHDFLQQENGLNLLKAPDASNTIRKYVSAYSANNKGTDQPVLLQKHRLISAFVIWYSWSCFKQIFKFERRAGLCCE